MTLTLRLAVDADQPGICMIHIRAIRESCSQSYSPVQIAGWTGLLSPESYASVLQKQIMIVAVEDDSIVGFSQLDPEAGRVEAMYVLPERQGQGIGRMMLSRLEQLARERGVATLELDATPNAVKFYEYAGYEQRQAAVHRLRSGIDLQCMHMVKRLPARDTLP